GNEGQGTGAARAQGLHHPGRGYPEHQVQCVVSDRAFSAPTGLIAPQGFCSPRALGLASKRPLTPRFSKSVPVDDSSLPVERPPRLIHAPIITVQQHILREQRRFAGASGEFSWLLSGITLATKLIEAKVRRAGLSDILGIAGEINVQGEVQQKLDVYANEMLL